MKISLQKITSSSELLYTWAMEQLTAAFPAEERRDDDLQKQVLRHPDYNLCAIMCDGSSVGVVGYWETSDFIYFENFCVDKAHRNGGIGSATLQYLVALGKTFILEIELPENDLTRRRKAFYERNGMVQNPFSHIQPHYRPTDPDLPLLVMTYKTPLTPAQYARFRRYLDENVDVRS